MLVKQDDVEGGVRILVLSRPPANAFNAELVGDLQRAVEAAARDAEVRAVIVRGNDRFFSGGLDLREMASGGAATVANFGWGDGIHALWSLGKPTVAEIAGHAIAGGGICALACDFRIAARGDYKIGLNETPIGLAFPCGAFEIARLALPAQSLARVLLEGDLVNPDEALALGLVHEVVSRDDLSARCLALARKLGASPSGAYAYNKRMLHAEAEARCAAETDDEKMKRFAVWTSEETLQAFMARAGGLGKH